MAIGHAAARRTPLVGALTARVCFGLALMVLLGAGTIAVAGSSRPADPLNRYPGFGFENSGVSRLHVGEPVVFSALLEGDTATGRATVTGVILPHIREVRLHVYAVTGEPQGNWIGPFTGAPHDVRPDQMAPVVGRSLHPLPGAAPGAPWGLTVALVATPLQRGCIPITGVGIRYRVGDTTFTKRMAGAVSVATGHRFCTG